MSRAGAVTVMAVPLLAAGVAAGIPSTAWLLFTGLAGLLTVQALLGFRLDRRRAIPVPPAAAVSKPCHTDAPFTCLSSPATNPRCWANHLARSASGSADCRSAWVTRPALSALAYPGRGGVAGRVGLDVGQGAPDLL